MTALRITIHASTPKVKPCNTYLSLFIPLFPSRTKDMMAILYMWPAMLSGSLTPLINQPVRLICCKEKWDSSQVENEQKRTLIEIPLSFI